MELVERTVIATFKSALGEPLEGVKVVYKPVRVFGAAGVTIPADKVEAVSDEDGIASAQLLTYDDDSAARYEARISADGSQFYFNLAQGSPISLETLRQIESVTPPLETFETVVAEIVQDYLEDYVPSSGVGGVLSGNLPNPGFAVNMATQAELDAAAATLTGLINAKASPADISAAIAALVDSSPAALNTLNELAAALGDDANFAATVTNALALKAPLASPALNGTPTAPTPADGDDSTKIATTAFVRANGGATEYGMEFFPNRFFGAGYVDHNICFPKLYTPGEELGDCLAEIEFEVKEGNTLGVLCDQDDGGDHCILIEVSGDGDDCNLVANINNGSEVVYVNGGTKFSVDERHRASYLVIGQWLYLYLDCVLDGSVYFGGAGSGVRTAGANANADKFYLGASGGHQGFRGIIYGCWIFEEEDFGGYGIPFATAPQAYQSSRVFTNNYQNVKPILSVNLTEKSNIIHDISDGFRGAKHHGFRSVNLGSQNHSESMLPQWVAKPFELPAYSGTPADIPEDAEFFDDFSDDNRTWMGNWSYETAGLGYPSIGYGRTPRLGNAWIGSSGSSAYPSIGILQGLACPVETTGLYFARQTIGTPEMEISFGTPPAKGCYILTRYVDENNYLMAAIEKTNGVLSMSWVKRKAGNFTYPIGGVISNPNATSGVLISSGTTHTLTMGGSTYSHADADLMTGEYFGLGLAGEQRVRPFAVKPYVAPDTNPVIATASLPAGAVDGAYSQTIAVTGGNAPLTFSVQTGDLPDGLILDEDTGEISGTPTTEETQNFTIRVTDNDGDIDDQVLSLTIEAAGGGAGLLDLVSSTVWGAWHVERLYDEYAGACLRVKDASDVEEDIGFDGDGLIDTAALSGNAPYKVLTFYDQSGNGRNWSAVSGFEPTLDVADKSVRFDGAKRFNVGNLSALTAGEFIRREKVDADPSVTGAGGDCAFGTASGVHSHVPYTDGTLYSTFGTDSRKNALVNSVMPLTNYHTYGEYSATNDWANHINGTLVHHTSTNGVGFPATAIYGSASDTSFFKTGNFKGGVLFSQKATTDDRAAVHAGL